MVAPTESPSASSSSSIVRVAVDLPFVPTTCTAGYAFCGSPSSASSACIRPRPKPSSGQGLRPATQAVCSAGEGIELTPVTGELRALRLDDLRPGVRDEPVVSEHRLGTHDLLAQPFHLGLGVAVPLDPLGADDGGEDPALVLGAEGDLRAATAEDRGRLLDPVERLEIAGVGVVGL